MDVAGSGSRPLSSSMGAVALGNGFGETVSPVLQSLGAARVFLAKAVLLASHYVSTRR